MASFLFLQNVLRKKVFKFSIQTFSARLSFMAALTEIVPSFFTVSVIRIRRASSDDGLFSLVTSTTFFNDILKGKNLRTWENLFSVYEVFQVCCEKIHHFSKIQKTTLIPIWISKKSVKVFRSHVSLKISSSQLRLWTFLINKEIFFDQLQQRN